MYYIFEFYARTKYFLSNNNRKFLRSKKCQNISHTKKISDKYFLNNHVSTIIFFDHHYFDYLLSTQTYKSKYLNNRSEFVTSYSNSKIHETYVLYKKLCMNFFPCLKINCVNLKLSIFLKQNFFHQHELS